MSGPTVLIRDQAAALLNLVPSEAGKQGLSLVMGRAAANRVKEHLLALNAERHRFGRNYYAQASRAVSTEPDPRGAVISINQIGIRQRLLGGEIRPKKSGGFLTIPATPEAYGKRAGEFSDLQLGKALNEQGRPQWALVQRAATVLRRRKTQSGGTRVTAGAARDERVIFWLVRKVTQRPDPSVLPSGEVLARTALAAGVLRISRLAARSANKAAPQTPA